MVEFDPPGDGDGEEEELRVAGKKTWEFSGESSGSEDVTEGVTSQVSVKGSGRMTRSIW